MLHTSEATRCPKPHVRLLQTDDVIPVSKPNNGVFLITIYCFFFAELFSYRGYYYFFLCRFSWAQRRQTASFLPGTTPENLSVLYPLLAIVAHLC